MYKILEKNSIFERNNWQFFLRLFVWLRKRNLIISVKYFSVRRTNQILHYDNKYYLFFEINKEEKILWHNECFIFFIKDKIRKTHLYEIFLMRRNFYRRSFFFYLHSTIKNIQNYEMNLPLRNVLYHEKCITFIWNISYEWKIKTCIKNCKYLVIS